MSDSSNPYQSPEANIEVIKPLITRGNLTEIMIKDLTDASPWMRFIGIMGFIGSGFYIFAGILALFFMPAAVRLLRGSMGYFAVFGNFGLVLIYALIFMGTGVVLFFPALFTYRFGAKIRSYTQTNSEQELELAFRNNKSLWKFNGILLIIGLAVIPALVIIAIVAAVAALAIG